MHNQLEKNIQSICSDTLELQASPQGMHLFFKGKKITALAGLHTVAEQQTNQPEEPTLYASDKGRIELSASPESLLAKIDWDNGFFTQTWVFTPQPENIIRWDITTNFSKATTLCELKAGFIVPPTFSHWQTQGTPQLFPEKLDWQTINTGKQTRINLIDFQNIRQTGLKTQEPQTTLVQNTSSELNARIIQVTKSTKLYFNAGTSHKTTLFITAADTVPEHATPTVPASPEPAPEKTLPPSTDNLDKTNLKNNLLDIRFVRTVEPCCTRTSSTLELFYDTIPLLCQTGISATLRVKTQGKSMVLATDCTSKVAVKQKTESLLVLEYVWENPEFWKLPQRILLQTCITAQSPDEINLECSLNAPGSIAVDGIDIALALAPGYDRWQTQYEQGAFSPAAKQHTLPFAYKITSIQAYSASKKSLPGIALVSATPLCPLAGTQNLISLPNSVGLTTTKLDIPPETTAKVFSGKIKISPDKTIFIPDTGHLKIPREKNVKNTLPCITVNADTNQLHEKTAKHFPAAPTALPPEQAAKAIRQNMEDKQIFSIAIQINRFNFFKAAQIARWAARQAGVIADLRDIELELFPVTDIVENFQKYLCRLKTALDRQVKNPLIEFYVTDEDLFDILAKTAKGAVEDSPKDMLRLLGVVCEHAFIGPRTVVFDPHHVCNANCLHCWVHTPQVEHPKDFLAQTMDKQAFFKIVDDLSRLHTDRIIFQGDGEPLMHAQLMEMIEYAREKSLKVMFFTNGYLLTEEVSRKVIDLGVDEIFCSLPAGDKHTFAKINPKMHKADPAAFDKILKNCKTLIDIRNKAGRQTPKLTMTHVIHSLNHDNIPEMSKNCTYMGADKCRFYLIRLSDQNNTLQLGKEEFKILARDIKQAHAYFEKHPATELIDNIDFQLAQYDEQTGSWAKDVFLQRGCMIGWFFNLIPAQLDMSFCCHLRTVGNLDRENFADIWFSSRYDQWRTQAKHMADNKQVKFLNNVPLFDEHCTKCDNHQVLLSIYGQLKKHALDKY